MAIILRSDKTREDIVLLSIAQILTVIGGEKEEIEVPNCFNIIIADKQAEVKDKHINVEASRIAQKTVFGDVILCIKLNGQFQ